MSKRTEDIPRLQSDANLHLSRRDVLKGAAISVASLASASALPFQVAAQNQTPLQLPAGTPVPGKRGRSFAYDSSTEKIRIWGVRGMVYPRTYFEEFLPALVDRTLVFDNFSVGAVDTFNWIFTGPHGGFTVQFKPDEVALWQRYYDSPGLSPLLTHPPADHFPEKITASSKARFTGRVKSVRVTLDSGLQLALEVNGRSIFKQPCVMDVERHQLVYSGEQPNVRGAILQPDVESASIRVDASRKHQTMLGFGGTTTPPAYIELSPEGKRRWWELLCEYNLLLHRDYPMGKRLDRQMNNWSDLADASPHYYGNNFPNCEVSDFHYLKGVHQAGGHVMFEFWQLPHWATQSEWKDSSGKVYHNVANPPVYTRAIMDYCHISQQRAGSPPNLIGIQNELSQPPEIWEQMTLQLRHALDNGGFRNIKLYMPDRPLLSFGVRAAKALRKFARAWKDIDFSAVHMYDFQRHFTDPDSYDALLKEWHQATEGKPFLSTELCVNDTKYQEQSYRVALVMGQLYHKNLTLADASAICYCWTLLNVQQPSFGWTRSLFVSDPSTGFMPKPSSCQLRVYGSFSRRVQEGMMRVDAESSNPDLMATAFTCAGGARTLIALNRSLKTQRVKIAWPGASFRFTELTDPYHQNALVENSEGNVEITVQPGSVVTLSNVPLKKLPEDFTVPA